MNLEKICARVTHKFIIKIKKYKQQISTTQSEKEIIITLVLGQAFPLL